MEGCVCHYCGERFARNTGSNGARLGGSKRPLLPGSQVPGYTTGATASLGDEKPIASETEFSIPLDFNGSEGIYFAPFGVQNEANLKSNWPDPAFRGAFLPAERSVRPDGFDGKWKVSYYGRDYPQSWTSRSGNERFSVLSVTNSRFGVQLLSILDAYRYVERSIKYGVLFLVLVLQLSFSLRSRRDRKFIRFNI
jgi:inner membrane protein